MTSVILFDESTVRTQLLPFTFTRPVSGIRCGIMTLAEKWSTWLATQPSFLTELYLKTQYPFVKGNEYLYINGSICPDHELCDTIHTLPNHSILRNAKTNALLAAKTTSEEWDPAQPDESLKVYLYEKNYVAIEHLWDIYLQNGAQIIADFEVLTAGRTSALITDPYTRCYAPDTIFIEEGVTIKSAILNAEGGPIYIGKEATISEGAIIQGPFAMGERAVIGQGAKIRPNTTIGPYSKVGGEVNNCVLFEYSNKAHDGYLGNSVLGEWCNLGANTNNSNLKNDYSSVKLFNYSTQSLTETGQLFCGLFMGDYTKAGISTMFNTGTVVGVNVNVFGAGFQPKHIPSFSWGGQAEGFTTYRFEKAISVIKETIRRREFDLNEDQQKMLRSVFEQTRLFRTDASSN